MKDILIILFILIMLAFSLVTRLFQSTPSMDVVEVFSKENILINVGLLILVVIFFVSYYLVRHFLFKNKKPRGKSQKAIEGLILVTGSMLVLGFAEIFGLLQKIPLIRNLGVSWWYSEDRIFFNSIILIGVTIIVALVYWIGIIIYNPHEDDEEEK